MRIRKKQVLFPLLPVTHSDPNLTKRSPVTVQLNYATTTSLQPSCTHASPAAPSSLLDLCYPSDQPLPPIGKPTYGSDVVSGGTQYSRQQHKKQEESLLEDGMRKEEEKEEQKGNDIRKRSISCSEKPAETFSSHSPPKQERWCEEEKTFPPKKRRGNFDNVTEDNNNDDTDHKKNSKPKVKRMKTKMNRNCSRRDDNNEGEEEEEEKVTKEPKPEGNVGKKRVRGGALMEGSRCSRVNGRGWRCCQLTLVGYSLCEHHLGKGRLRSMTSVRNKSIIGTTSGGATKSNSNNNMAKSEPEKQTTKTNGVTEEYPLGNDAENSDEKKPVMVTKRRMKLGMVKARSISSLLGQTNTELVAVAKDNNDNK